MSKLLILLVTQIMLVPTLVYAQDYDEDLNYEEIVNELSAPKAESRIRRSDDPFEYVKIHTGVGFITSSVSIEKDGEKANNTFLRGVEASIGVDLFNPNLALEGALRSFNQENSPKGQYNLKEFDLRISYRESINSKLKWRMGAGVSSRFLNYYPTKVTTFTVNTFSNPSPGTEKYVTPAALAFGGIETYLSQSLSLGVDISYRSAMIAETADKSAVEFSVKLDVHF